MPCPLSHVDPLLEGEEPDYLDWLLTQPESMIYFAPCFLRFLESAVDGTGSTLIARRAGRIVGALPYVRKDAAGLGSVFNSQPWYGSHGGCILEDPGDQDARQALCSTYRTLVESTDWLFSTVILTPGENVHAQTCASMFAARTTDARVGQITELPVADAQLEQRLERTLRQKTRNLVRKARGQGFREHVGDEDWAWRYLFETHVANMRAIGGRAKPEAHFQALRAKLPSAMRRLSVALFDGLPVAAMLLVLFNRTVEYITPVITHDFRPRQPLSFLIWEAMLDVCRRGFQRWNWGGTWINQTDLHHFKAGFGASDHPYTYLVSASERGIALLDSSREDLFGAFPNFYLYPLAQLGR